MLVLRTCNILGKYYGGKDLGFSICLFVCTCTRLAELTVAQVPYFAPGYIQCILCVSSSAIKLKKYNQSGITGISYCLW